MPEQPDNYNPTETDLDMVIEATTGKPLKPESLAAGIASMRQRINEIEAAKARLLNEMDAAGEPSGHDLNETLATYNKDLVIARERLSFYEAQLGTQN
jgi:hypothetical protein